jgi:hypothetical protein
MAVSTYYPSFSEIFEKVSKLKTKKDKVAYLKEWNTDALRIVVKSSFDPKIEWLLPKGEVPFNPNEAPEGTEHTTLQMEARQLYRFVKGGDNNITQNKREMLFVQMLEGLQEKEAHLLVAAKDKRLHQVYKGLSKNVVMEAFDWDDNYMVVGNNYPQAPGPAAG